MQSEEQPHYCWALCVKAKYILMHTHAHTCIVLEFTTARNWLCGPHNLGVSQQEAKRVVEPLAAGTPASSPQLHGPLSAVEVLICGLARPAR